MTTLAGSATSSFAVATVSVAVVEFAAKVVVDGDVPSTMAPSSVTLTSTVSAVFGPPLRLSVNDAAVPSVTGDVPAAIDTSGVDAGPGIVADAVPVSLCPSDVQIAGNTSHAPVVGASDTCTAPSPDGRSVTVHRLLVPRVTRRARTAVAPVTSRLSLTRRIPVSGGDSLKSSRTVKTLDPSCSAATDENDAVSAVLTAMPNAPEAVFAFSAASLATPAGTSTESVPDAPGSGVTVTV